jgi:hypothetical protein
LSVHGRARPLADNALIAANVFEVSMSVRISRKFSMELVFVAALFAVVRGFAEPERRATTVEFVPG